MDDRRALQQLGQVSSDQVGVVLRELLRGSMRQMICKVMPLLNRDGKLAILIGGFSERGRYQPLSQLIMAKTRTNLCHRPW